MNEINTDCYTPAEVAEKLTTKVSTYKFSNKLVNVTLLGILAGVYIAFGGLLSTLVGYDSAGHFGYGFSKLLCGFTFSIALILVMIAGGELFTGNTLMVTGLLSKKGNWKSLFTRWTIVYFANFAGAVFIALLFFYSGLWRNHDMAMGVSALSIANAKVNLTFVEAFIRGILANWLVCLAVYLSMASKDTVGKILGIIFPVMAFVALGFEHSIANMFFIPMGLLLKGTEAASLSQLNLNNLNLQNFIFGNLFPVTLGNIIGGAFFVGIIYWFVYVKGKKVN